MSSGTRVSPLAQIGICTASHTRSLLECLTAAASRSSSNGICCAQTCSAAAQPTPPASSSLHFLSSNSEGASGHCLPAQSRFASSSSIASIKQQLPHAPIRHTPHILSPSSLRSSPTAQSSSSTSSTPLPQGTRTFFNPAQIYENLKYDWEDPQRRTTNSIILLNIAMWLASTMNPSLITRLAQNSFAISRGEWWRFFTAPFLHSGFSHLAMNMLATHWLAPPLEMVCGRTVFFLVYLLGGAGGGLAHHFLGSSHTYVLGSSGCVAGLFAAYVVYKWRNRNIVGFTDDDKTWIMQMVGINLLLGLAFSGSLAHIAHGGGAVGGAVAMYAFGPRYVREWGRVVDKPIIPLPKSLP